MKLDVDAALNIRCLVTECYRNVYWISSQDGRCVFFHNLIRVNVFLLSHFIHVAWTQSSPRPSQRGSDLGISISKHHCDSYRQLSKRKSTFFPNPTRFRNGTCHDTTHPSILPAPKPRLGSCESSSPQLTRVYRVLLLYDLSQFFFLFREWMDLLNVCDGQRSLAAIEANGVTLAKLGSIPWLWWRQAAVYAAPLGEARFVDVNRDSNERGGRN